MALIADTSLTWLRLTRELNAVAADRGLPGTVVLGNGTEITSMAVLHWSQETGIEWRFIIPERPTWNALIEGFNRRLQDDFLDETLFSSIREANGGLQESRRDRIRHRPHSALGNLIPQ